MCKFFELLRERRLAIPHPEEPMNPRSTIENTDLTSVFNKWLTDWEVPLDTYPFWRSVKIELVELLTIHYCGVLLSVPAAAISETLSMQIDPRWTVPGVLAHELCHISYSLLSVEQKAAFAVAFEAIKSDPLVSLLFDLHPYGKDNAVEGHADLYRYLAKKMPNGVKQFYPKLF